MKKYIATVLILLLHISYVTAQEVSTTLVKKGIFGISAEISQGQISDKNIDTVQSLGVILTYITSDVYSLQSSISQSEFDFGDFGEMKVIPIIGTVRYHFEIKDSRLLPYIGGGVGYYITEIDLTKVQRRLSSSLRELEDEFPGGSLISTTVEGNVENKVGIHALGGIEYKLSPNFRIFGNARYTFLKLNTDITFGSHFRYLGEDIISDDETIDTEIDFNSLWLSAGITFVF